MNAHCERFNRTVQEQFVDWHEDLLFTDLTRFNQKLGQWLIDYNTRAAAPQSRPQSAGAVAHG
ncbi:MAG TPA: hypothetical protein DIT50_01545, partial [Rhodocyclaceae bacterium]|nr:hypothetical protein [Rhodocyclaceae bacterium]